MGNNWTFGQKIGTGFAVTVLLAVAIAAVSVFALRSVVESKDRVITVNAQNLQDAQRLEGLIEQKSSEARGFLLTREERFLEKADTIRAELLRTISKLKTQVA